jgi:chromosome segregation ATPase
MDLTELTKRLEFLEKERRKDKAEITSLTEKLSGYESALTLISQQMKDVGSDMTRLSSTAARLEQFDALVTQNRAEFNKAIEDMEKRREKSERDVDKRRRLEIDGINKSLADLNKSLEGVAELRKSLQARVDEDLRLSRLLGETQHQMEDFTRAHEDSKRSQRAIEDNRKQDVKRLADMQGELASMRKRTDETRERTDLNTDTLKMLDARINELLSTEADRRQAQNAFIEQQNLAQVERDRAWKDWTVRFDTFNKQTGNLDAQLTALEETHRAVKRAQETHDELNQRMERRINEITEMQRLAEDRFRQEWVTFKADDQKRWTNYSLAQDEITRDLRAQLDKLSEHATALDDNTQTLRDLLEQTSGATETQMQELMNWAHEWLSSYERIMGHARPKR